MTKEEIIRSLKYTKEKHKNDKVDTFGTNITLMCEDVLKVLDNCIETPECATNGDMIEAMFPYGKYGTNGDWVHVYGVGGNGCLTFTLDWWNAPYEKVRIRNDSKKCNRGIKK